jgi:Ni/Co efflux regulator RcnB
MGTSKQLFIFAMALASLITITPAFAADNAEPTLPTKVYVHRTYEHQEADRNDHQYPPNLGRAGEMVISDNDKIMLGKYVNHYYKTTCAWEHDYHAKKCVAPSPAPKRNYIIGYNLPSDVAYEEVPAQVTSRMHAVPTGYKYVRVGNDVVLINASSREVVDAVTLLSTYGQ